jgi:hypothetical protein
MGKTSAAPETHRCFDGFFGDGRLAFFELRKAGQLLWVSDDKNVLDARNLF